MNSTSSMQKTHKAIGVAPQAGRPVRRLPRDTVCGVTKTGGALSQARRPALLDCRRSVKTAYATIKNFEVMRMFKKGQFAPWDRCDQRRNRGVFR